MKLSYNTPLSQTGVRAMHLDLTLPLSYANESLTGGTVSVTAIPAGVVTISNVAVNTAPLTNDDGTTCAIGKGVQWKVTAQKQVTEPVKLRVAWAVSGAGSADTHEIELPMAPYVTR